MSSTLTPPPTVEVAPPQPGVREFVGLVAHDLRAGSRAAGRAITRPRTWTPRWMAFGVLAALYVTLSLFILIPGTAVLHLDTWFVDRHLWHKHPGWYRWVSLVVDLGQRWILLAVLGCVFVRAAFRSRSLQPVVLFVTALVTLTCTVGAGKYLFGRVGPIHGAGAHTIFHLGGNIFPSGHVSNTVVLYGVLAWAFPRYRRRLIVLAAVVAICVGAGTVYLRTHWFSDVVGGWIAGGLVLLLLPTLLPYALRLCDLLVPRLRSAVHRRPAVHRRLHRALAWGYRVIEPYPEAAAGGAGGVRGS